MSVQTTSSITQAKLLRKPTIADQLLGESPIDDNIIKSSDDFDKIYKVRHDLIHALICDARNIPFGEKPVSSVIEESGMDPSKFPYLNEIKNQTPDYLKINGPFVTLIEISVSRSKTMEKDKISKYALLTFSLAKAGLTVMKEIIIINPDSVYHNRDKLIREHKLNDNCLNEIKKICDNCRQLESAVKNTPDGQLYYLHHYHYIPDQRQPVISAREVIELYRENENKPLFSEDDVIKIFEKKETPYYNKSDDVFMEHCLDQVSRTESKLAVTERIKESEIKELVDNESRRFNGELQTDYRSIFPLPYLRLKVIDSSVRSTEDDLIEVTKICGRILSGDDPVMSHFASAFIKNSSKIQTNDDFPFRCNLSSEYKYEIALEGPNRKKYAKRPDLYPEHFAKQKEHSMYSMAYDVDTSGIEQLLFQLSGRDVIIKTPNFYNDSETLANLSGFGLDYVRVCQSIYREVNINSLRKDRKNKFMIKPTGIKGVFVFLYKGVKLRTGELPSQIWFKVLIDNDFISSETVEPIWAFKRIKNCVTYSQSHWLSVDAHRLDHYLRCYDKILMAYYSFCLMKYRTTYVHYEDPTDKQQENRDLFDAINNDQTNTLGVIIATYMEDRRSTSKMLQNVRFLVMASLSIFRYTRSVLLKCIEPVRSPLQLYFLKKMVKFAKNMEEEQMSKNILFGRMVYDIHSKTINDQMGGARVLIPRPIISGPGKYADFAEILSEMYLSMLFNKNQDDPTHSSFQILSKMLEGEKSMEEMKNLGHHLGYRQDKSDEDWATEVINNPHTHKFSARAIEVGSKLVRERCGDKIGSDIKLAASKGNLNKTLDEFATYKSSAKTDNLVFSSSSVRQNSRSRCLEAVIPLVNAGLRSSFDVVDSKIKFPVEFQIFKKNQIGGVREILILNIISRIKINVLETLSRNICQFDKRETLTHGASKNDLIKEVLYEVKKKPGKRMAVFFSMDKSRWGPSFVPIQFLYLFTPFKEQLGSLFPFIFSQLILHQNKKCILPERLIRAWSLDPNNRLEHRKDKNLQNLKEKFLKDFQIYFVNESNMGQGILHYTSSYLHAAMISFRDKLYEKACQRMGLDSDDHFDLFSSDDSFTALSVEVHLVSLTIKKINIFMKCQEVSERLFNCSTSKAKSSINPIIGEFNSLFMSNLTFFPTLIKFALASVHPVNTDSFFKMVKESYAACRPIMENGGTLDLYSVAHVMNKRFCESIYHTGPGMINSLEDRNIQVKPYHLGTYPIFNPTLMLIFGPEFHNYKLFKNLKSYNQETQKLFRQSHKIAKGQLAETMAELEEGETMMGGLLRIEATIGPINQYTRIRGFAERELMKRDEVEAMIVQDPLLLFKPCETIDQVKFKIMQKVLVPGAQEAVKTITASIYYGRVSASVSAEAFHVNGSDRRMKYIECVDYLINYESQYDKLEEQIKFLYPKWMDYEIFLNEEYTPIPDKLRSALEIQTIRHQSIFKVGTRLYNSVVDVIKYLWMKETPMEQQENKLIRDVHVLKTFYPMVKDTLEETRDQFAGNIIDQTKSVVMLLLKLYSLNDRNLKAIIYGTSTSDIRDTYQNVTERNSTVALTHSIKLGDLSYHGTPLSYDDMFLRYNYFILSGMAGRYDLQKTAFDDINDEQILFIMGDNNLSKNVKKRILIPLMFVEKISDIEKWTEATATNFHYWEVRQRYDEGKWAGNFDLIVFRGRNKMRLKYNEHSNKYHLYKTDFDDPELIFELLTESLQLAQIDIDFFTSHTTQGDWICRDNKILFAPGCGFNIISERVPTMVFAPECRIEISDMTTLRDATGFKIAAIKTGLMNCVGRMPNLPDFESYGVPFSLLVKNGVFAKGFDLAYKSVEIIRSFVINLHVPRPMVTQLTKDRLGLPDDFKVRDISVDDDILVEPVIETVIDDPIMDLLDIPDEEFQQATQGLSWDTNNLETFVDEFIGSDFFSNIVTSTEIQHPIRTLNIVKNLKFDCISLLSTTSGGVGRQTIIDISHLLQGGRQSVIYSLISRYDRTVAASGQTTPDIVIIRIDKHLKDLGVYESHKSINL